MEDMETSLQDHMSQSLFSSFKVGLDLDLNGHGGFSLLCYFSKQPFHTNINHQEGVHLTKSDDPCTIPLVQNAKL